VEDGGFWYCEEMKRKNVRVSGGADSGGPPEKWKTYAGSFPHQEKWDLPALLPVSEFI